MCQINPDYYTKGRRFQPIQVIEEWSLCHHLACTVKYLSRAGRKEGVLLDLRKAEWYLQRELGTNNDCNKHPCSKTLISLEEVIEDWQLSMRLGETLMAVKYARNRNFTKPLLEKALHHLKAEISIYEERINL